MDPPFDHKTLDFPSIIISESQVSCHSSDSFYRTNRAYLVNMGILGHHESHASLGGEHSHIHVKTTATNIIVSSF
jgi:hypothetical protein